MIIVLQPIRRLIKPQLEEETTKQKSNGIKTQNLLLRNAIRSKMKSLSLYVEIRNENME